MNTIRNLKKIFNFWKLIFHVKNYVIFFKIYFLIVKYPCEKTKKFLQHSYTFLNFIQVVISTIFFMLFLRI